MTQERNLNYAASVFNESLDGVEVIALPSVPVVSPIVDLLTRSYRTLEGGLIDIDITGITVKGPLACKKLLKANCERLIVHSTLSPLSILSIYAKSKIKKVLHLHDIPIHMMIQIVKPDVRSYIVHAVKRFEEWAVNKAEEFVSTTFEAAESWRRIFHINPIVLHPGCNPSPVFPYPKKDYILSITSWEAGRKPLFLLDVMERLRDVNLKLAIAGKWHDVGLLRRFKIVLDKRNLQKKVYVFESLSENELVQLYRGARCVVYPMRAKLVMTSLESAAQGTPVLSPSGSGAWELFEPNIHGFAVEEGSIESYAENIAKFERDNIVKKMGQAIWEESFKYSWSKHALQLEKILA